MPLPPEQSRTCASCSASWDGRQTFVYLQVTPYGLVRNWESYDGLFNGRRGCRLVPEPVDWHCYCMSCVLHTRGLAMQKDARAQYRKHAIEALNQCKLQKDKKNTQLRRGRRSRHRRHSKKKQDKRRQREQTTTLGRIKVEDQKYRWRSKTLRPKTRWAYRPFQTLNTVPYWVRKLKNIQNIINSESQLQCFQFC